MEGYFVVIAFFKRASLDLFVYPRVATREVFLSSLPDPETYPDAITFLGSPLTKAQGAQALSTSRENQGPGFFSDFSSKPLSRPCRTRP